MRSGGRSLCSFLFTFVFSIAFAAEAAETTSHSLQIGRIHFELILGNIIHHPADAWVASHGPDSVNMDKAAAGALAQIDQTPFEALAKVMHETGRPLSYGTIVATGTGPAMQALGVKRFYHSIDYQAFNQILFFTPEDLIRSNFPFSEEDRAKYERLLEDHRDILVRAKPLAEKGRLTFLRALISVARDATAEEKEILKKLKPVYEKINELIIDYYPTIHVETGIRSISRILSAMDNDPEIKSVAMPTIGDGFFAGMALMDAIADVYISAFNYVTENPQGKPITVKLIVYGHPSDSNVAEIRKIFEKFATFQSTWKILETLGTRTQIKTVGIDGLNRFRREVLHLGDLPIATGHVVEDLQPQPVPAATLAAPKDPTSNASVATTASAEEPKSQRKGLVGRLCERFLK